MITLLRIANDFLTFVQINWLAITFMSRSNYLFLTVICAYSYGGRVLSKNYSLLRLRPSLMAGKYTVSVSRMFSEYFFQIFFHTYV